MSYSTIATTQCAGSFAVADFNGDGLNDLAYPESACDQSTPNTELVIRPGVGSGSFGPEQTVYQNLYNINQVYPIRSTTGTKPDLTFGQSNATGIGGSLLLTNTSNGTFPGCGATVAEGIRICTPGASATSPVKFSIGAAGPTSMRTAAVWVDGKKVAEQLTHAFSNYSFLDASIPLAAGSHAITVYGTGWDDTLHAFPGTITGTLARMEVWVDGVKKYTETSSTTLNATLSLPPEPTDLASSPSTPRERSGNR
jgi:hypothetical protein